MESLERGSRVGFRVASGSMRPALARGDKVLVKRFDGRHGPRLGDIVLFHFDGRWTVHRVIGGKLSDGRRLYRQRGDAEFRATLVPASAVAGRVISIEHDGRGIDLDNLGQKLINRSIGVFQWGVERLLHKRGGVDRGLGGIGEHQAPVRIPVWRMKAAGGFRRAGAALARLSLYWPGGGPGM